MPNESMAAHYPCTPRQSRLSGGRQQRDVHQAHVKTMAIVGTHARVFDWHRWHAGGRGRSGDMLFPHTPPMPGAGSGARQLRTQALERPSERQACRYITGGWRWARRRVCRLTGWYPLRSDTDCRLTVGRSAQGVMLHGPCAWGQVSLNELGCKGCRESAIQLWGGPGMAGRRAGMAAGRDANRHEI